MNIQRRCISRRTLLRGAGAAMALPFLDAMQPLSAAAETAGATSLGGAAPTRMAFLYFPNGVWTDSWIPKTAGADYELPFSLSPLAGVRSEFSVLSGLDKAASHEGDGHYAKTANLLTGAHVNKTTGKDISAGGISVDQLAARELGDLTPIPSLELSIDPVVSGIDSLVGYTRLYASYISWRGPGLPVAREMNPRAVYDLLFGAKDAQGRPTPAALRDNDDTRSLLDMALDDARDLRRRVGRDDQGKMDEYLESVRAVEKRIDFSARPSAGSWKPTPIDRQPAAPQDRIPADYVEHVRLMLELMVLAFWTDSTRIGSFMFANDVSARNFSQLVDGVHGAHHEISHHKNDPDKLEQYRLINRWHVEQLAMMLEKMRSIREGDGTLLDHSMVFFGSSMSDGNRHDPANLPILLAGRGGGLNPGRHVANPQGTPLCNLYVSMLDRMGVPTTRFGDSTGKLAGLEI